MGVLVGGALLLAAAAPVAAHASIIVNGGTYVAAAGEANRITIDKHVNDFTYTDLGAASINPGTSSCSVAGNAVTCPWFTDALAFDVFTGDQDDTITDTQGGHPFELDAGPGEDEITASEYLPVSGGVGNDHIVGGPAADSFFGEGRGIALPDNDRMEGLGGRDQLYCQVGDDLIDGGEGDDHLEGGNGNDVVHGGPGNDFIDGLQHSFGASGDGGSDVLDGGDGDDALVGSHDNGAPDTFACGPGSDVAEVGAGDQVQSDCEEVDELVGCAQGGGCTVALVVSAIAPSQRGASAAASKRHGRRVVLGTRTTGVGRGASKELRVRLNRRGLKRVLRGDGKANALIEVKVLKKKRKPKRMSRTPFGLRR